MSDIPENSYLEAPLGLTCAKTALPIIFVMGMNGLLAVADALFLGHYVGPQALAAVTLIFPLYMLVVALATLVSSGMSSVLARHLGANRMAEAQAAFAGAHGLALLAGGGLIVLFLLAGRPLTLLAAAGSAELAGMGLSYLRIVVVFSPLLFLMSVNSDALRNEGRVGFMAGMSLLVSTANIGFNYLLIAGLGLGVAGSAYGTVLAQALAFAIILAFRLRGPTHLRLSALKTHGLSRSWRPILAALQMVESPRYDHTVSAYGIITRVMTFAFLPLLGLSYAMQTITGNNYGAALWRRSDGSLRFALGAALIYCALVQVALSAAPARIGGAFVEDAVTIAEVARILPVMVLFFVLSGPLMMISMHFQAIGDARRAGLLGLAKPYLFALPLTFLLAALFGEAGIWAAGPVAELCLLALTAAVLAVTARQGARRWGLFETVGGEIR